MPKTVIDLSAANEKRTFMLYGASGSGKTHLAGTFPRPLFLSDRSEKGWLTLKYMDPALLYETNRKPEVWEVGSAADMAEALTEVERELKKNAERWLSVITDSLTFYADSYFADLEMSAWGRVNEGKRPEGRILYGDLASHLRYHMIRVHNLPIRNIAWICLEKVPSEGSAGGIALPGQSAEKAPARCDFWFYCRADNTVSPVRREVRTKTFGAYGARDRVGGKLPDPLPEPTYRAFEMALNNRK